MRLLRNLALMLGLALGQAAFAAAPEAPSPDLGPDEVIAIVLEALAHPDRPQPGAGIARTFRFAAPANRARTGPLPRFTRLLNNPVYAPLLGHERARRGELQRDGDRARQRVEVIAADGSLAVYVFVLERQRQAPCAGCWMTLAVVRVRPEGLGA